MQRIVLFSLVFVLAGPASLLADRLHSGADISIRAQARSMSRNIHGRIGSPMQMPARVRIDRHHIPHRLPVHPGVPGKPVHPIYPGHKPGRPPIHDRPRYWWPVTNTVVQEPPTIIIVNTPPAAEPPAPPEPEKVWVPPVMDTRTEPGYWDYGVKKVWMGDHWRYEQDVEDKTWVPESQVQYVKQEGYWEFVQ